MKKKVKYSLISALFVLGSFGVMKTDKKIESLKTQLELKEELISSLQEEIDRKKPLKNDVKWLALNIYHESRGETIEGMLAVGVVTLNRVNSPLYPNTIEKVVKQNRQFSWYQDGRSNIPYDVTAWNTAKHIAEILLTNNNLKIKKKLSGVCHYHATSVRPMWAKHMDKVDVIGNHIFYN